ncbi:MAG: hypothetical protein DI564_05795 [Rhodanobacter denitrificans]|uniref:DUF1521 domain-containing protein n=1 Tax=Rhodanobacter denitrificans TaxID=666685 RepID=A0A2W5KNA1_9GAMM|nr:MAG: hypothetical protein DI564_05795 [Rhodanobacter denitrificans]
MAAPHRGGARRLSRSGAALRIETDRAIDGAPYPEIGPMKTSCSPVSVRCVDAAASASMPVGSLSAGPVSTDACTHTRRRRLRRPLAALVTLVAAAGSGAAAAAGPSPAPDSWALAVPLGGVPLMLGSECPAFVFRDAFERGTLTQAGGTGSPLLYVTRDGYTIRIDLHTITVTDPQSRNTVQHWGDPHENLNGKHIKDWGGEPEWDGSRRSLLVGGAKITMHAAGPQGVVLETSIYDGDRNLRMTNTTNTLVHFIHDAADTAARDAAEYDGETAAFDTDAQALTARYLNVYNEDPAFQRIEGERLLGTTGGCANPNQVNDFYDDPRLGHT